MNQYPHPPSVQELTALIDNRAPIIIEVGCHNGKDTERFLAACPRAQVFCFEPDARAVAQFQRRFGDDARVKLYPYAVSDHEGTTDFYASTGKSGKLDDWDLSGSISKPTGHLNWSPQIKFKDPIQVNCFPLDYLVKWHPHIHTIDFAWIDVQGAQNAVIKGGQFVLEHTKHLYIECHQTPMYEDEPTQLNLLRTLRALGFYPVSMHEGYNFLLVNDALD